MEKHYVTFGQIHAHAIAGRTFDRNCVAVINCKDHADGRQKAFEYFGRKFGNSYHQDQWNESYLEWFPRGLIEVNP